jgi:hypothetical protein
MAKVWDIKKLSIFVDGIEITDLRAAGYSNDPQSTVNPSTKGPVGFNIIDPEPTFTFAVASTCEQLAKLKEFKNAQKVVSVEYIYEGDPAFKARFPEALITKIDTSSIGDKESPDIAVEGIATKCIEE